MRGDVRGAFPEAGIIPRRLARVTGALRYARSDQDGSWDERFSTTRIRTKGS